MKGSWSNKRDNTGRIVRMADSAGDKCAICNKSAKDWKLCKCPQTCKICLRFKMLGENGSCSGCECGNSHNRCSCVEHTSRGNTEARNSSSSSDGKSFGNLKPPDIGQLKKKENLEVYSTALRRWSRLTAVKKKEQGDIILHYAHSQYSELAVELDTELSGKVASNEGGVDLIIEALENKFGRSVEADLRMSFHKWFHTVRAKDESLIDYVNRFERNYNTFSNLGESLTPICQALILLENANLDENFQSLISSRINFKSAKTDVEKLAILNECKEALRKYQYGRKTNVPCREMKMNNKVQTLCNDLIKDGESEDEVFEKVQEIFLAKNRKKSNVSSNTEGKPVYKCNICICGCPRETDCGCSCTKHFWYNCPQKDKKNGSGRGAGFRGGRGNRGFRGNRGRKLYRGNRGRKLYRKS